MRVDGWFAVEGTILGDGRTWDQVRFNAFPSKAAFLAVVMDPARLQAQKADRESAIADTYIMIVRPTINRLAASVRTDWLRCSRSTGRLRTRWTNHPGAPSIGNSNDARHPPAAAMSFHATCRRED